MSLKYTAHWDWGGYGKGSAPIRKASEPAMKKTRKAYKAKKGKKK